MDVNRRVATSRRESSVECKPVVAKPSKIGKYDVIEVLGRGGMGVVYLATDPHLSRLVAIKMMTGSFSDNPDLLKRFYREAQSTGNLQHPNIVTVYDLGDLEGTPLSGDAVSGRGDSR
jgi:serine/threonine protein kinase